VRATASDESREAIGKLVHRGALEGAKLSTGYYGSVRKVAITPIRKEPWSKALKPWERGYAANFREHRAGEVQE
jgi:hypothetical protein